jgi:enoyl-CoA hydratase/carnithine racemase
MTDFNPRHFLWRREGRVGVITLNRPEKKNPLTFESYAELRDLFRALADKKNQRTLADKKNQRALADGENPGGLVGLDQVETIVLTGAGANFCSGGDVHEIIGPLTKMNYAGLLDFTRMTGDLVKAMRHCPQPIVAAVDGVCAGAGAILAMASDLRIGTPRTKTAFLFTRVGLAGCDMGACAILPRIIGHGRASELLFTGRSMSSEEGAAWGFFNRIVAPEAVLEESLQLARELAAGPTFAHAMTKKMLHEEWDMPIDVAIDAEAEAQAICMQTEDFSRAYRAFAAKQKPKFEGN